MMKNIVLVLSMVFGSFLANAKALQSEITFVKTVHNFGTFSETSPVVTCKFSFKNTGNAPLIINQAITSCGCTIPSYTNEPVLPGEYGELSVTYNGTGRYPGHFKKVVTVRTNAKNSLVRLYIEGEMTVADNEKK